jgi:transcriptional regulator with XRE-family HTH domain
MLFTYNVYQQEGGRILKISVSAKDKAKIGTPLKKQREKDGKSLRGLAKECDMNFAVLHDIEEGNSFPTEKNFLQLMKKLNFSEKKRLELFDLYGAIKETAPPDVVEYLFKHKAVVCDIRRMINQENEVTS